jgi:hypothetical protein
MDSNIYVVTHKYYLSDIFPQEKCLMFKSMNTLFSVNIFCIFGRLEDSNVGLMLHTTLITMCTICLKLKSLNSSHR